jgi:hypothetical protein
MRMGRSNKNLSKAELKKCVREERDYRGARVRYFATRLKTYWETTGLPE